MFDAVSTIMFGAEGSEAGGQIEIEQGWQLISIPCVYGQWDVTNHVLVRDASTAKIHEYVVRQLEDKYGPGVVTLCSTYFGDEQRYRDFVPGITPLTNSGNFPLMAYDPGLGKVETIGFWIVSTRATPMTLDWMQWV